jgi:GNAT superfamily N-acetyltransferase
VSVEVRPLARGEVPAAVAVLLGGTLSPAAERPDDPNAYWRAAEETTARGGAVLVALEDGEVVGLCQVLVLRHFQHAGGLVAELESVYVRQDRRGRGVGGRLLEAAEALARERGCYRVQFTSNLVRVDAHRFYEARGYAATHRGFKKSLPSATSTTSAGAG